MKPSERTNILRCLVLVGAVYLLARWCGWTFPGCRVEFHPIIWPLLIIVAAWGLWRLAGRLP